MLYQAGTRAQVPVKRALQSGLHIEITATAKGYVLIITRDEPGPGENEMHTILKHWPYFTGQVEYRKSIHDRRPALIAEAPKQQERQLKF